MDAVTALIKQAHAGDKDAREELFKIGCIGLIKAIDKFETAYEVNFSTYAVPMIMGEI